VNAPTTTVAAIAVAESITDERTMGILTELIHGHAAPRGTADPAGPKQIHISLVHGTVRGRARFAVSWLYRNESARPSLESQLRKCPGIEDVSASPLTGQILIRFDPSLSHADILQLLIGACGATASKPQPAFPGVEKSRRNPARPPRVIEHEDSPRRTWHTLSSQTVLREFNSSGSRGLTDAKAASALARYGPNTLARPTRRGELSILLGQFKSLPVALLGASAALSLVTGGLADAIVILGVVCINAGIGYVTESQAERTIDALGHLTRTPALVLRDGAIVEIEAEAVVPGDILVLAPGSRVAADGRLIEARDLSVDESALTGESLPVAKAKGALKQADLPLADRTNMIYMGTVVTGGSGFAVVVATGRGTEIGTIQALVGETRPPATPMQRQLDQLGNQMVILSGAICGVVFVVGLLRGYGMLQMLRTSISLAVAAVPEGLPTVATTTLALGIRTMRRHKVLIRHLDAVETLGAVQVICLDKTGTLTANRMAVQALHVAGRPITIVDQAFYAATGRIDPYANDELLRLLHVAVLCNDTEVNGASGAYTLNGSATESALIHLAIAAGVQVPSLRGMYPRTETEYRAENRNYMLTRHRAPDGGALLALKGSPEEVLALCHWWLRDGTRLELSDADRESILIENDKMAGSALRVLGFAYRQAAGGDVPSVAPEFTWLGIAGMADPVREGVKELIGLFHQAGIDTVMITGDQSATAYAIGKELELSGGRSLDILDSTRLDQLEPEVLKGLAQRVSIFSRVSPANKLQIVQALQRANKIVAMTGDGINDSPALKAADIGVAMGDTGTSVARDVADVVLEDDNLHTMIIAVSEGRTIYSNIRKSIHFLTSTNLSEIAVMLTSIAAGMGTPLNTMQLLWINLITDIFPALALAVEQPEPDVLRRPPRDPEEPIIGKADFKRYAFESGMITAGTMAAYGIGIGRYGIGPQASTNAFMTLTFAQLLHAYSSRSERYSIFSRERLAPNPYLNLAVGGSTVLQAASVLVPGLAGLLGNTRPGLIDLITIAGGAGLPLLVNEATKSAMARPAVTTKT
jgi:Ca2+-transporting ATPase